MEYGEKNTLYASSGQFTTLDGKPYIGPYHIMELGIPMTEAVHTPNSATLIPVQQKQTRQTTTLTRPEVNTVLDENATVYDLIPVIINKPPVIVRAVAEASTPPIKPYAAADATGDFMYQFEDGTVRVHKDTSIVLRAEAVQPNVLNVENGILEYKPSNAELVYSWTFDGEPIGGLDNDPLTGAQRNVRGNEIILTRMQPPYAGTYTCTVSNDIGSTDAGSINLEIYNSTVDSFFYQNLIRNGDASDGTSGWESINDGFVSSRLESFEAEGLKSIVINPFNEPFAWTTEMFTPKPYHLNYGELRPESNPEAVNNQLNTNLQLSSYFTRLPYTYTVNGNIPIIRAYQDIDLSGEIEAHIKGAIYGVDGLRGVLCAYIGNAIFNYELTDEFVIVSERNDPSAYYLGAPRLSVENFSKAGPGFVAEKVSVTIQEFTNNQPLESRLIVVGPNGITTERGILTLTDPWTKRLPNYRGQKYYQGDKGYTVPDQPSIGDNRDAHLFVADELMPEYQERYSFGQYAEFNKQVIERLDPRTDKIRVTINIEAPELGVMFRERGSYDIPAVSSDLKLWETLPWVGMWPSRSLQQRNSDGFPNDNFAFDQLKNDTNIESTDIFQKIPQIGESRTLISGLTFALVPIYRGRTEVTDSEINSIFAQTEFLMEEVPSPIQTDLPPYNALQELEEKQAQEAAEIIILPVPVRYTLKEDIRVKDTQSYDSVPFDNVTEGPPQTIEGAFTVTQELVDAGKDVTISAIITTYHNNRDNSLLRFGVFEYNEDGSDSKLLNGKRYFPTDVNNNNKVTKKQNYTTQIQTTIPSQDLKVGYYYRIRAGADVNRDGHNHTILADQSFVSVV